MSKTALAMHRSRGGMGHSCSDRFKTKEEQLGGGLIAGEMAPGPDCRTELGVKPSVAFVASKIRGAVGRFAEPDVGKQRQIDGFQRCAVATRWSACESQRLQWNFIVVQAPEAEDHCQQTGNPVNVS